MSKKLLGKVALVTGGAKGIGEAVCRKFALEGASKLVITDLDEETLLKFKDALVKEYDVEVLTFISDVASEEGWKNIVKEVEEKFGYLDILVNNAGVSGRSPVQHCSMEEWQWVTNINQTGVFLGMKYCYPLLKKSKAASIINISSVAGLTGYFAAPYTASKWGVRGVSKTAAMEFGGDKIRVNSIHPGFVETPLVADAKAIVDGASTITALERPGQPDEIANVIAFIASDEASYITGAEIAVDGGLSAGGGPRLIAKKLGVYK